MRPDRNALRLLGVTRAKAKMWEYQVPERDHILVKEDPAILFDFCLGSLGDLAATMNGEGFFPQEELEELHSNLKFSAQFLDSYSSSRLSVPLDPLTSICASACFYLCDMPGSALVLAKELGEDCPDLGCLQLEDLLLWLLQGDLTTYFGNTEGIFGRHIGEISQRLVQFFEDGNGQEVLLQQTASLRDVAYKMGTPRQLLFADVICAIVRRKLENSAWYCLPLYSALSTEQWQHALKKETFIRELWPAQRIIGEQDVLRGKSAVVLMPTSAGKTKAAELIVRSAFFSHRTSLAVLVAPYRALCHEISDSLSVSFEDENVEVNELSDVTQKDFTFDLSTLEQHHQILVLTPEKFHYVLRHEPELTTKIGLAIYDEAHLFDDPSRGVNYELLLSSVSRQLPVGSQTVLVSAVIKNAEQVAKWLLGDDGVVVAGMDLTPTSRSVAYASWTKRLGQLQFPVLANIQDYRFFVPRVLEEHSLQNGSYVFPGKDRPNEIALYLGLKLVQNGGVAIFCGRKDSAAVICRTAVKVFKKGLPIPMPVSSSDGDELEKIGHLIAKNLGNRSEAKQSADLGILAHHGNVPHGIRLAVEHALQKGSAKFVVCTSTLAQGVNLPIRYLIVTSVYQGRERIKTRDFHNLIGRAGRAGKHTEGSIIFADPRIYDRRRNSDDNWRWQQASELLDPLNSEECASAIVGILSPIFSDRGNEYIVTEPLDITRSYLEDPESFFDIANIIAKKHQGFSADKVMQQLMEKLSAIRAIQSYLLAHSEEWENDPSGLDSLVEATFAYALADIEGKQNLKDLFRLLKEDIEGAVPNTSTRHIYGRTLLGLKDCIHIEEWVSQNLDSLQATSDEEDLFRLIWPLLRDHIQNRTFVRCNPPDALELVGCDWIGGLPYKRIFEDHLQNARLGTGLRPRRFKIEHVVDLCENGLGYDGALALGAIAELVGLREEEEDEYSELKDWLFILQKRLKYGLPSMTNVILFELGFADRVLAQEIQAVLRTSATSRRNVLVSLRRNYDDVFETLSAYPSYYIGVLEKNSAQ